MRIKLFLVAVVVLVTTMLLSACMVPAQQTQTVEAEKTVVVQVTAEPAKNAWGKVLPAGAAPPDQQVLTLPCQEGKDMDVSATFYQSAKSCGAVQLWERLVMLDENNKVVPGVATTWELAPDGLSWTFHLRPDAKWSDGSPLTAGDFEYALKRQLDPKTGSDFTWFYSDIKNAGKVSNGELPPDQLGIKAVDDQTLVIETEGKVLYLPQIMAFPSSAPVPRKIVEQVGANWTLDPKTALSNGPWKLEEYLPGKRIVIGPNPNYVGEHVPNVERFTFLPGPGTNDFPAYRAGDVDGLFADQDTTVLSPADYKMVTNDTSLRRELYAYPYMATRYVFFDPTVKPWDNLKVRQAISHALDRDAMIQVIYSGLGQPAYGMLPPGIPGYPGDALNETQKYDPELAKKLLAEAGYPDGKGFPEVELWYKTYEEALPLSAQMIQAMLKENLNIDVKLRPTEKKVFNTSFDEGQIDFGIQNWEYDYVDPSNFLNVWNPALGRHKEWNNAEFNKLTNEAAGYPDLEKRLQMYTDANRILSEDVGGAFLYHWGHAQMWKPYVQGIPTDAQGNTRVPYYNLGMNEIYVTPH